ncbi:MAG: recombinase family protein [Planctomycetes bacterium]|nr:recombinase family protein [Planctomycetota bacterium]
MTGRAPQARVVKAAIYARVSREDPAHAKISVEQQVEDGNRLASENGLGTPIVHLDRDLSGKLFPRQWGDDAQARGRGGKYRQGLTDLIEDIEAGRVNTVIVRKLDRLSRNVALALRLYEYFSAKGVALFATDEKIPGGNDASGKFTLTLLMAVAQYEMEKTVENTRAAKQFAKRNGLKISGCKVYGYRSAGRRKVEVVPEEAAMVKRCFELFVNEEQRVVDIHRTLAREFPGMGRVGHGNQRGGSIQASTVNSMLRNPLYIGRTYDFDRTKGATRKHWELIPSKVYERIVSEGLWTQAQNRLRAIRYTQKPRAEGYFLSGLVLCECGERMRVYKVGAIPLGYYGCVTHDKRRSTTVHTRPAFAMQVSEWERWATYFLSRGKVQVGKGDPGRDEVEMELRRLKITANLDQAREAMQRGELEFSEYHALKGAVEKEIAKLDTDIRYRRAQRNASKPGKAWTDLSTDERREMLQDIVTGIRACFDGVEVELRKGVEFLTLSASSAKGYADLGPRLFFPRMYGRPKTSHCPRAMTVLMPDDETMDRWCPAWRRVTRNDATWMAPDWRKVLDAGRFFVFDAARHKGRGRVPPPASAGTVAYSGEGAAH